MLNAAVLMGRLTADPELKHTPNSVAVTSFTIAVDRKYNPQGEKQADFIDIVAWRNTADFVCRYFSKGQMIAVQGSIQTRTYEDKSGGKRKAFEIVADNVSFCGDKQQDSTQAPVPSQAPQTAQQGGIQLSNGGEDFEQIPIGDDDLPF